MVRPNHRRVFIFIVLVVLCSGCAHEATTGPATTPTPLAAAPIHLYRTFLSGADGHRCPMTPSCSSYALSTIKRHGALLGWIMACDRLMRCGRDELDRSPKTLTPYGWRWQDSVDDNDFWLR